VDLVKATRYSIFVLVAILIAACFLTLDFNKEIAGAVTSQEGFCGEVDSCPLLTLQDPPVKDLDVVGLQIRLAELGYYQGPDDGVFDREMAETVKEFKSNNDLTSDEVVDDETWRVLAQTYEQEVSTNPGAPTGHITLTVDVPSRRLTVYADGVPFRTFPVAVGKKSTPSPIGEWRIVRKAVHWGTGFGTRWMGLNVPWGTYGIHGTNKPWSIGTYASHGCIRMLNKDVELLYQWVQPNTLVKIVGPLPRMKNPPTLRKGQANQDVVALQFLLQQVGVYSGDADGRFGDITEEAVKTYQLAQELPVTGIVDQTVWKSLWSFIDAQAKSENPQ
jgi:lipoprotein-anchoring transpeptidase ErfK/SrfK